MLKASELEALHRKLVAAFGKSASIGRKLSIVGDGDWRRYRNDTRVSFSLTSDPPVETTTRNIGGVCAVYELPGWDPYTGAVWFSWYEEWKKTAADAFELIGASLTFYWGTTGRQKPQLLRAEWDTIKHRGGKAAQPHWHVDTTLMVELPLIVPERAPLSLELLEELPPEVEDLEGIEDGPNMAAQDINLKALHLGMGGWENAVTSPQCWQKSAGTADDLLAWASQTLVYSSAQFRKLRLETSEPLH